MPSHTDDMQEKQVKAENGKKLLVAGSCVAVTSKVELFCKNS